MKLQVSQLINVPIKTRLKTAHWAKPLLVKYRRFRLFLDAIFNLPHHVKIGDKITINAWNWQVSSVCKIETTQIKAGKLIYEPEEIEIFRKLAQGKKIFFDVGAQIGYYSFIAIDCGVEKVVAFELLDEYANLIKKYARNNNLLERMQIISEPIGLGGEIIKYDMNLASGEKTATSLNTFCKNLSLHPDIMKMDIEGFEYNALRGATEILKRKPVLVLSIHPLYLSRMGQKEEDVLRLLKDYNYRIFERLGDTVFAK